MDSQFFIQIFLQLLVIIAAARLGAWAFGKFGQPQVVGEIAAGLLLGPSFLGQFSPDTLAYVFPAATGEVFLALSELGLILLMFLIGLEFDFSHLKQIGRTAATISVAGIAVPFALGGGVAWAIHPHVAPDIDRFGFVLFVATALSITAIPILGRIMVEFNLQRTRLGVLTITAAAVDDALGWILLAAVAAIVAGQFQILAVGNMLGLSVLFVIGVGLSSRYLLSPWLRGAIRRGDGELAIGHLSVIIVLVLATAIATTWIGIFPIFGPFVLGAALSHLHELRDAVLRRLRDFVHVFFLPIFFTYTGLRTDIGTLDTPLMWLICGVLLLASVAAKFGGCGLAARLAGLSWRESGCVAIMMNTRALMGLIAINIGRDMNVIPDSIFCMLVIMALVTTFATTPILRRLLPENVRAEAGMIDDANDTATEPLVANKG